MIRKTLCVILALAVCGALVATASAAFINTNVVVTRVGTGAAALSSNATEAFLDEYDNSTPAQAAPIQSLALPTSAVGNNAALTLSGTATSEGFLTQSVDGTHLTIGGYNAAPGTAGVTGATAATVNRVVGLVNIGSMAVNSTTAWTDAYNASNIRSTITTNGTDIWTGGNGGSGQGATAGVRYGTAGTTSGSIRLNNGGSNMRVVNIFNGQLYTSSSTGAFLAVSTVGSGIPTTGVETNTLTALPGLPTTGTHSAYDFWFKNAQTLYIADDGSAVNGGGIQKWTESGGTWTLQYILLNNGSATTATRGLAGSIDANGDAVLYGTNSTQLFKVVDTGAAATATILATAATNTNFRGVELIRIPEPASLVLVSLAGLAVLGLRRRRR